MKQILLFRPRITPQLTRGHLCISLFLLSFFIFSTGTIAMAEQKQASPQAKVIYPVKQSLSQPLRTMKVPLHPVKVEEKDAALPIKYPQRKGGQQVQQPVIPMKPATIQQSAPVGLMPATVVNFEGLDNIAGYYPPDTCGDVGPDHYLQVTNVYFQVYDKTTGAPMLPAALPNNAMWNGFGGVCETTNDGDPIVLYDQFADRWLFSQFSISGPFHQCIAISQTGDPTGAWYRYDYEMSSTIMNDYPHFGVWPDGYYLSFNQFDSSNGYSWAGQGAVVFDRTTMLSGGAASGVYFDMGSNTALGAMLPADADGATPPPAGTPNYFVQMDDNAWGYPQDQLELYEFHVDWTTPANSTFTASSTSPLAVTSFTTLNRTTVPQPETTQKLDNLGDRLMYRLQYRNFGTHQSMVVNHTVDTTGTGDGEAGIRWYELRNSGSNWAMHQQGTYAGDTADDKHRWMGSIAMDSQGNMALGYSVSNATDTYPSIRYVGRLAGDTAGTLPQGEATIIAGGGSQTGTAARWGDYSMMSVDPTDDCTFWYTQEYYETTSAAGWQTRIASFKFPSCTAGASGILEGTVTDSAAAPLGGATVAVDNGSGIQLSTTTATDGSYTFTFLPVGSYTVSAEKYGYITGTATGVAITAGNTSNQNFTLADAPFHTLSGTVTDGNTGWPLYAKIDHGTGSVWTNPATGAYTVDLPEGSVSLTVTADHYATATATINLTANTDQDFGLQPDASCTVPGYYQQEVEVYRADFEASDGNYTHSGTYDEWEWGTPITWPAACASGTKCWGTDLDNTYENNANNQLLSPVIDLSAASGQLTVKWSQALHIESSTWDHADAEVSINGGAWTSMWSFSGPTSQTNWQEKSFDISAAAGTSVQFRWRMTSDSSVVYAGYYIDDVTIIKNDCSAPTDGGMIIGNVYDANTSSALNGTLVDDQNGHTVTTIATPDDDNLDDGFYSLHLPTSGTVNLVASKDRYQTVTTGITVPALGTVAQPIHLPAGQLSAAPTSFEVHIAMNSTLNADLSLINGGGASADFQLQEIYAAPPLRPNGPFADQVRHVSPKHLDDTDASGARYDYPVPNVPVIAAAGAVVQTWPSNLVYPWGIDHQNPTATLWLGNLAAAGGDDLDYEFQQNGTATGNTIAVAAIGAYFMADFTYDWSNDTLWQVAVSGDNCIHELDPVSKTVTGSKICPAFGTSMRGLAYNPKTDTFYAGGWLDSTIHEFDRSGAILRSTNVGLAISGLAFNPVTDHLFVMVNGTAANPEVYVVTVPESGDFVVSGQFDIPGFSDYGGAGLAMDCAGKLWAVEQNTQIVYQVESGEASTCSIDIPWLTVTPASGAVAAASQTAIVLDLDSTGMSAGPAVGFLQTINSSPYGSFNIPVTMVVEPNQALNVSKTGSGSGAVVADSGAVNCGSTCSGDYPYNAAVTLTATRDAGSTFLGWTGDCNGTAQTCTVTMNRAQNVGAAFSSTSVATKDLAVGITGSGTGGVTSTPAGIACGTAGSTCTAAFTNGSTVTLTAMAVAGSTFMGWTGACTGNGSCSVTMSQSQYVSASFTNSASPTVKELVVSTSGNGLGGVTSTPVAIFCGTAGSTYTAPFDNGIAITLTATPAIGTDVAWSGDCTGSGLTCNLTMTQNHAVTASFTKQPFTLTVTKAGKGDGTVTSASNEIDCGNDCENIYDYGTSVVLTAKPDQHSALGGWLGGCNEPVTDPPSLTCTVDILQDENVTAIFKHVFPWPMFLPAIIGGQH